MPFLAQRHPAALTAAFLLVLPLCWHRVPLTGTFLAVLAVFFSPLSWREAGGGVYRMRFFFLALLVTHGWLVPGETTAMAGLSPEGVQQGALFSWRLVLLLWLAMVFVRSLRPWRLLAALDGGRWGRWPFRLLLAGQGLPMLSALARESRETLASRPVAGELAGQSRWSLAGQLFLRRLFLLIRMREEAMAARGIHPGVFARTGVACHRWSWRDGVVLLPPLLGWWLV